MWQTPESIVSPRNSMPRDSSSARAGGDVVDSQCDRMGARRERDWGELRVEQLQGQVAGLVLAAVELAVPDRLRESERLAVELGRNVEVLREHGYEVDSGDQRLGIHRAATISCRLMSDPGEAAQQLLAMIPFAAELGIELDDATPEQVTAGSHTSRSYVRRAGCCTAAR